MGTPHETDSKVKGAFAQEESNELTAEQIQDARAAGLLPPGMLAFRHNWGFRRGQWVLNLTSPLFKRGSLVFVSIGEGVDGKFIGAARYTVHNVAPNDGVISIWLNIEWGSPISISAD
jgi:hypothetical protein